MPEIETVPEITAVNEPLLPPSQGTVPAQSDGRDRYSTRVQTLLGLFAGRRGASLLVRQNVALYLEDWREAWGYSFPVVVIDTLWNLTFVVVALAMLLWFAREETNVKLRVWICGYSMQCVVHVVLLVLEYKRRISTAPSLISSRWSFEDDGDDIHPIRYGKEGASEAEISRLPKYIFEVATGDMEQPDVRACRMMPRRTNGPDFSTERVLLTEEADCCICLCHYEDGEQLHLLPCSHHFHSTCIAKWLRVKATCPVCKSLIV
ncbi:hypothetical protein L1987_57205 [Smallanthus sonchifolius]|uniref:Uncharacterized protein n=1 Tax=Smallanthus sonchifolius TaxID=185202 RepID=A0ACB9DBU4_9ASTR|nr:hypothetical protein L1987_57205 [Smallanthus sonchifolius]